MTFKDAHVKIFWILFFKFFIMVSAAQVNDLRKITGAGIMECKTALVEANGDENLAVEILRKKGAAKAAKKSGRDTKEGSVFIETDKNKGVIVLLNCETDFVANNDKIQNFGQNLAKKALSTTAEAVIEEGQNEISELIGTIGENIKIVKIKKVEASIIGTYLHSNKKIGVIIGLEGGSIELAKNIAMHAAATNPSVLSPTDIDDTVLAKEKEIWIEQLKNEGKPENIIENILKGKERKFREENALISQVYVKDSSKKIENLLKEEGSNITDFIRLSVN